jgi:RNA polymerase sigma-70 factor (ECF subfamily)
MSLLIQNKTTETELIEGCLLGNRRMQELFYQTFAPKMYSVCLRYTSSVAEAQDILQEGFIKVFNKLESYRSSGSFEGWIRKIFIHTAYDHHNTNQLIQPMNEIQENITNENNFSVLEQMAADEVLELVGKLPDNYRTIFNLSVVEGYTHKEIAELLGISEGTSKAQLAKAKAILQNLITKQKN